MTYAFLSTKIATACWVLTLMSCNVRRIVACLCLPIVLTRRFPLIVLIVLTRPRVIVGPRLCGIPHFLGNCCFFWVADSLERMFLGEWYYYFQEMLSQGSTLILEAKTSYWQQYCTSISSNTNLSHVWQVIKCFSGQPSVHHIPTLVANGISGKNNQHKANMLANKFVLSSSASNYTPHFVNSTLPKKERNLQHTLSHPLLQDTRLNQAFSIDELLCSQRYKKYYTRSW